MLLVCLHVVPAPDPASGPRSSVRDFVTSTATFRATYAVPMPHFEIAGSQPRNGILCRAPFIKKARGHPQAARLTAGEQRARVAAFPLSYKKTPYLSPMRPILVGRRDSNGDVFALAPNSRAMSPLIGFAFLLVVFQLPSPSSPLLSF